MDYQEFLKNKIAKAPECGFEIDASEVNPIAKGFTKATVVWMVRGGRRACFSAFGLHKTITQIEAVRITRAKAGGMGLIVLPLGVRQEFFRDAEMLTTGEGPTITDEQRLELKAWQAGRPDRIPKLKFIRRIEEAEDPEGIYLTNYETVRDGKLDPQLFSVSSLDEAACLRGFGGTKTFREFMALFAGDRKTMDKRTIGGGVKYRFVATATPSPNDYIEMLAYSAYLGIMDVSAAKTRFFKRDSTKADHLTIHPHKEQEFWLWVASWGLFVQRPSDLGFSDEGYELPALDIRWHRLEADHTHAGEEKSGQQKMFQDAACGVVDAARVKRTSLDDRVQEVRAIVRGHLSGDSGREESQKEGLLQGLVREEQGCRASKTKGAEQGRLPSEKRTVQDPLKEMERRESGAVQSCDHSLGGEEPRKGESDQCGVVPTEQGSCFKNSQSKQAGTHVQYDRGTIREHEAVPGRELCDMRDVYPGCREVEPTRGPLSLDREGQGITLPPLQRGTGSLQGQSRAVEPGGGVSTQIVIWCDLNDEQKAIESMLTKEGVSFSSLYGNQSLEERELLLAKWRNRETTVFLSKPMMYGAGVNLQQAHIMIYAGIGFKFADIFQGIHRIHRYLQAYRCIIHFIYTAAEDKIRKILETKWENHKRMVDKMTQLIREFGLSEAAMAESLTRAMGVERVEISGERYRIVNNDSVKETAMMEENSVGLILTSIPFSTQYEYSPNYADFGHTDNNEHFFQNMDFLTPNLFKILKPGRIAAIHVKDRIVPGGMTGLGFQTVYPFHARAIDHYCKHGFGYMGMKTIVTDVVRENNQTYRLGWSEQCKDGSKMGVGMPEYLLIFRKPPTDTVNSYADEPVVKHKPNCMKDGEVVPWYFGGDEIPGDGYSRGKWQVDAHGFTRSSGNRLLTPQELETLPHEQIFKAFKKFSLEQVYDFEHHVKISEHLDKLKMLPTTFMLLQPQSWHPDVWSDITRMLTLNGAQSAKGREGHLCPMQFDLADRAIDQWSMPGEVVYDPFGGLMTVPYRAILKKRFGMASELSHRYFLDGATYCKAAEDEVLMPSLFEL